MARGFLVGVTTACFFLVSFAAACSTTGSSPPESQPTEITLRAADAEQMRIIVEEDTAAQ
jgi:hypothetical protein